MSGNVSKQYSLWAEIGNISKQLDCPDANFPNVRELSGHGLRTSSKCRLSMGKKCRVAGIQGYKKVTGSGSLGGGLDLDQGGTRDLIAAPAIVMAPLAAPAAALPARIEMVLRPVRRKTLVIACEDDGGSLVLLESATSTLVDADGSADPDVNMEIMFHTKSYCAGGAIVRFGGLSQEGIAVFAEGAKFLDLSRMPPLTASSTFSKRKSSASARRSVSKPADPVGHLCRYVWILPYHRTFSNAVIDALRTHIGSAQDSAINVSGIYKYLALFISRVFLAPGVLTPGSTPCASRSLLQMFSPPAVTLAVYAALQDAKGADMLARFHAKQGKKILCVSGALPVWKCFWPDGEASDNTYAKWIEHYKATAISTHLVFLKQLRWRLLNESLQAVRDWIESETNATNRASPHFARMITSSVLRTVSVENVFENGHTRPVESSWIKDALHHTTIHSRPSGHLGKAGCQYCRLFAAYFWVAFTN
ncbi:hypothetical protein BDK51DRAFT_51524 [Blyttiomyces helicus]|uniref:Uncharacterized protein n=1 Tax=Blyttiomyces helicus TaxID=388810 RepID=A0A4P9W170_9FUNG|nr:hypothetical protein BDK51DRAFT_51524 [Blyttiomyces helicus]|eukprot:RKO85921.1 hypothetical protein BDK51DRAFT_51524 [Blyttiomyces helicus]